MVPQTRYARNGELHIAYQTVGDGPIDLVVIDQWFSNVDAQWSFPPLARLLTQLGSFSRVIVFDKRGTGLSDPVPIDSLPTIEEWSDDLRAVLDAVGSERPALLTGVGAAYMALVFAATHPGRTSALVLVDPFARITFAEDYPLGAPLDPLLDDLERLRAGWGVTGGTMGFLAPNLLTDGALVDQLVRYERQSVSPGQAKAMLRLLYETDVRDVLPAIRVPTLVMHHSGGIRVPVAAGKYVADRIPGARFLELPGSAQYLWAGDSAGLAAETQAFLTGVRPVLEPDRVLATVLFTDLVDSTGQAAALGDAAWREVLGRHHRVVRQALDRFLGREVKSTGDGFLATFDGPARAVRCALAIRDDLAAEHLPVRSGLHTGEIELTGNDVAGLAVHIAARVLALAGAGEILVSSTVKDLVAGSGLAFDSRGLHRLKGVPDEWALYSVRG